MKSVRMIASAYISINKVPLFSIAGKFYFLTTRLLRPEPVGALCDNFMCSYCNKTRERDRGAFIEHVVG